MRRSVYLDHSTATKNSDNTYTYDFQRHHDRNFNGFQIKSATCMYNPLISNSVTATEIAALNPHMWFDFSDTVVIAPANITQGTSVNSITSKGEPGLTITGSAPGLNYDLIGQAPAVLSTANWHGFNGTSPEAQSTTSSFTTMFQTKTNTASFNWIWKTPVFRFQASAGIIRFVADVTNHPTNLVTQVSTPYILQAVWNSPTMEVELINLTDMTSQTETIAMPNNLAPTPTTAYSVWNAQTGGIGMRLGTTVELSGINAANNLIVVNYMKQLYTGTAPPSTGEMPHSLKLHSSSFSDARHGKSIQSVSGAGSTAIETLLYKQTLDSKGLFTGVDGKIYNCENTQLDKVDLEFRDPQNNIVDVSDFTVSLDLANNTEQL